MYTIPQKKEQLGLAHLYTIASTVKITWDRPSMDMESEDIIMRAVDITCEGAKMKTCYLAIQLKSTVNLDTAHDDQDFYVFDLPRKNYDDLREANLQTPRILVVYLLPPNEEEWVDHHEEETTTRKCAYWCSIKGLPATANEETVRVRIPKRNVLSPQALREIFNRIARGEEA